jgi:alpha-tubulin suppressor-like RCC1 family protein
LCWGDNIDGQLGDGTLTARVNPTAVTGAASFTSIGAGGQFTCGLTAAGAAYCWGRSSSGQLGYTGISNPRIPQPVGGSLAFSTIDVGFQHTCAIANDKSLYCWGAAAGNGNPIGTGATGGSQATPAKVQTNFTFEKVSLGLQHTCGITTAAEVVCWGNNTSGQLGNGTYNNSGTETPQRILVGIDP